MTDKPDAGTLVSVLRTWLGLTQKDFGDLLGVSRGRISQWETGADDPPTGMLIAMSNLCPDARSGVPRPDAPSAKAFLRLAKVYEHKENFLESVLSRITQFIRKVDSNKAQILELQSRGGNIEEQLEQAMRTLAALVPDVKESSEIPGVTEREAAALKKIYSRRKFSDSGKKT